MMERYVTSCDTLVTFSGPVGDRRALFAKNSDRPGLECQSLTYAPAREHPQSSTVTCQYLSIPQAPRTLAVLGSRPWWLWGFEHGVNEAGVAIGNEAIYTRDPVPAVGLLGMDLVRLGLERGATAAESKDVITELIELHSQGGPAVNGTTMRYHNSFIVADATEAWVIETSGRHWVARRTTTGAVIANLITIEDDWDESSPGLERYARDRGYWRAAPSQRLNFRAAFEDPTIRPEIEPRFRVGCKVLANDEDQTVEDMIRYLRDHFDGGTINSTPVQHDQRRPRTVCLHPGTRASSTSASMVTELRDDGLPPVAWITMATPCSGVFIPVTVGCPLPHPLRVSDQRPNSESAWWAMRELQYVVDKDPDLLTPIAQAAWGPIERELLDTRPRLSTLQLEQLVSQILERRARLILELNVAQLQSERTLVQLDGEFILE